MKMRDLVKQTGVSKEMIHYFTREGLLPDIEKTSPNQAVYSQEHVERLQLIRDLQEKHFLPISLIKRIINRREKYFSDEELLKIKSEYFMTMDHLLPRKIEGEVAFLEYSGISPERLADFEGYGIINFEDINGVKTYSHDAVKLGKLIGDMRKRGLSKENGFTGTILKEVADMLAPVFEHALESFKADIDRNRFSREEIVQLVQSAVELSPLFYYHMARNYLVKAMDDYLDGPVSRANDRQPEHPPARSHG